MHNLGNLCFISLVVCLMSKVLAETEVSQPSNGDPLHSLDTEAEIITDVAADEAQLEEFADGNHENLKNSTDGEVKDGEKCSSYEIASKNDVLSLNKTLGNIQKDAEKTMKEVMIMVKVMRDHLYRLEESMSTLTKCPSNVPLRFHSSNYGSQVKLSADHRSATRTTPPWDSGLGGSVVSQRRLCDDEIFTFRIDKTLDKWNNFGIAVGVVSDPGSDTSTSIGIFKNGNGTWAIRSAPRSQNGTSITFKDGDIMSENVYPMNTNYLSVGNFLGVSRHKNGDVHFYLSGVDKGVAFEDVPKDVYAFVDIMNYVTKISVL